MSETSFPWHRFAVIADLAAKAPKGKLGHTALVKYAYFLQTLRRVPLGYDFSLYAYGPYDSRVLDDLDYAETLGAVTVNPVYFGKGYGYEIRRADGAEAVKARASEFLARWRPEIDWVIQEFGHLTAADLELASTIVYVDQEQSRSGRAASVALIVRQVRELKPHFSEQQANSQANTLREKGLLQSLS